MRKTMLLTVLMFLVLIGFSQHGEGSSETIKSWKNKTLIVIQYPNSEIYNSAAKTVAEERWYTEKIEYLDYANIKEVSKRDDIVVLNIKNWFDYLGIPVICLTTKMNGTFGYSFTYNNDGCTYMNIQSDHIANWDEWYKKFKKDKSKVVKDRNIAWGLEVLRNSSLERTKLIVEVLFNTADRFEDGEYVYKSAKKDNLKYNDKDYKSILNTKTLLIVDKTIPTTDRDRSLLEIKKIRSIYKGKVEIVTESELEEAIKNEDEDVVYLHLKEEVRWPTYAIIDISKRKIIFSGKNTTKAASNSTLFTNMLIDISNSMK